MNTTRHPKVFLGLALIVAGVLAELLARESGSVALTLSVGIVFTILGPLGFVLLGWGLVTVAGWRKINLAVVAVSGAGFATFSAWTRFLPVLRVSAWTLRDAVVRSAASAT